ncbi:MAG: Holliday junction DNA helicase RuvA [Chloroflexi bacterium]|nr:Holliday junction DNA helicase RuvA [Chloroflexota bacterium]
MISFISGKVRKITQDPSVITIDNNGIGYDVNLPVYVYQSLVSDNIEKGSNIELEVYYHVTERQPKPILVGFRHPTEKDFFEKLIQVEGIGPLKAANALILAASNIALAIETEDVASLQKLPGIGSRAAQKIIATLKGKVTQTALYKNDNYDEVTLESSKKLSQTVVSEGIDALVSLGYRLSEAQSQIQEAVSRNSLCEDDLQELLREVFKSNISK